MLAIDINLIECSVVPECWDIFESSLPSKKKLCKDIGMKEHSKPACACEQILWSWYHNQPKKPVLSDK